MGFNSAFKGLKTWDNRNAQNILRL